MDVSSTCRAKVQREPADRSPPVDPTPPSAASEAAAAAAAAASEAAAAEGAAADPPSTAAGSAAAMGGGLTCSGAFHASTSRKPTYARGLAGTKSAPVRPSESSRY